MDWLLKTEPSEYSFDDLVRDEQTVWTGVTNPVAVKNIRSMHGGDRAVIYHTGDERAAVGLAKLVSAPRPDPKNPKSAVVDVAPTRKLKKPVSLEEIKKNALFAESPLVRIGRLSVVPLTAEQYAFFST